jgi:hydroxymethylpyrimidine pyrophosphatase-like HAD family hydrolase
MAPALPRGPPRFTLVSDLDGTLVDPSDPTHAALRRFNAIWEKHCAADCRLVYSTGRSHKKFQELRVRAAAASLARLH